MEWLGVIIRLIVFIGFMVAIITAMEVAIFIADIKREEKDNETDSESK